MPRKSNSRAAQGSGTVRKKTVTRNGKTYQYWEARYTAGTDPGTGKQIQREKKKGGAYIYAPLKNDKARTITPAPWVMDVLRAHRAKQAQQHLMAGSLWENSGLVFTDEKGHHLAIHSVYTAFKKVAASIGRPDARFHDLRHSYAVAAIRSGDDIKTVQGNLGHATAAFTLDVYGHVTDQMKEASAARMENYIKAVLKL